MYNESIHKWAWQESNQNKGVRRVNTAGVEWLDYTGFIHTLFTGIFMFLNAVEPRYPDTWLDVTKVFRKFFRSPDLHSFKMLEQLRLSCQFGYKVCPESVIIMRFGCTNFSKLVVLQIMSHKYIFKYSMIFNFGTNSIAILIWILVINGYWYKKFHF